MKLFVSESFDPFVNISTEEMLLKDESINEDIVFIWRNKNTIFFGRNQNIHEEINADLVRENDIKLVRRLSGGGAVYHDEGNVNFTFITKKQANSYEKFLAPIIEFLKSIGLGAKFKGKNDLEVSGYKISGNAQYIFKERMFHHGTLLFDANLSILSQALKPNQLKLESKGIKSVSARVTNIRSLLKEDMSSEVFIKKLIDFFVASGASKEDLSFYKNNEIHQLSTVRKSYDWNYQKNPEFNVINERRFNGGTIKAKVNVLQNKISDIIISGDFLSKNNFEDIYKLFIGQKFDESVLKDICKNIENFDDYFGLISIDELVETLLGK